MNLAPQFLAPHDLVEEVLQNAMLYCLTCGVTFGSIKPVVLDMSERQVLRYLDTQEADLKPLLDFGFRLALYDFGSSYGSFLSWPDDLSASSTFKAGWSPICTRSVGWLPSSRVWPSLRGERASLPLADVLKLRKPPASCNVSA